MIISHSRRFTFIHISKTGGTSIERALEPFLDWRDLYLGNPAFGQQMHDSFQQRFELHKHSSVAEVERICGTKYLDEYYLFALVRHPADRLCSLYNFVGATVYRWAEVQKLDPKKFAAHIDAQTIAVHPFLEWAATRTYLATSSFSEFIRHNGLRWDVAFKSQVSKLVGTGGGLPKGQIFRLEDSPSWLPKLQRNLCLELTLSNENQSDLKLMSPDRLSHEDKQYIEETFADDYAAFAY